MSDVEHRAAIVVSKKFFEKHCKRCPWLIAYTHSRNAVKVLCEKGSECEYFSLAHTMIDSMYE
ncbi:MAG: hypothetical protein J7L98_08270 [Candidatus Verstraetearchaeota archaeon]|nr:hypothetical protein [Candidatus Verstraetearchaeota archaeon]